MKPRVEIINLSDDEDKDENPAKSSLPKNYSLASSSARILQRPENTPVLHNSCISNGFNQYGLLQSSSKSLLTHTNSVPTISTATPSTSTSSIHSVVSPTSGVRLLSGGSVAPVLDTLAYSATSNSAADSISVAASISTASSVSTSVPYSPLALTVLDSSTPSTGLHPSVASMVISSSVASTVISSSVASTVLPPVALTALPPSVASTVLPPSVALTALPPVASTTVLAPSVPLISRGVSYVPETSFLTNVDPAPAGPPITSGSAAAAYVRSLNLLKRCQSSAAPECRDVQSTQKREVSTSQQDHISSIECQQNAYYSPESEGNLEIVEDIFTSHNDRNISSQGNSSFIIQVFIFVCFIERGELMKNVI